MRVGREKGVVSTQVWAEDSCTVGAQRGEGRRAPRARVQAKHFSPPVYLRQRGGAGGGGGSRIVLLPTGRRLNEMERRAQAKTKPAVDSESLSWTRIPNGGCSPFAKDSKVLRPRDSDPSATAKAAVENR